MRVSRDMVRTPAFVVICALSVVAAACGPGGAAPSSPAAANDQLARILARGTLVGYYEPDYQPFSYALEGGARPADTKCLPNQLSGAEVTGFDVETTKLLAQGLGVEACFVNPTWTEVTAGNWGDRWDIAYGSGSINEDRMQRLYMTQPYYATPNYFFVREDSPYQVGADLSGKRIGSCASCSYEAFLKRELVIPGVTLEFEVDDPEIVTYDLEPPGLQAVADGKIDAFLASEPIGLQSVADGLPLRPLDKPAFTYYPSGFVDKSSGLDPVAFVGKVNEIIRARQADGSMKALSMEFLAKDYASGGAEFDLDSIGQQVP